MRIKENEYNLLKLNRWKLLEKNMGKLKDGWSMIFKTFMQYFKGIKWLGYQECGLDDQTLTTIGEELDTFEKQSMNGASLCAWKVLCYREKAQHNMQQLA